MLCGFLIVENTAGSWFFFKKYIYISLYRVVLWIYYRMNEFSSTDFYRDRKYIRKVMFKQYAYKYLDEKQFELL